MHNRATIGLQEAWTALRAMMQEAEDRPGRPIAVAVVDHRGDLVCFASMGDVNAALARQNALKKAYTSACMRADVKDFEARAKAEMGSIAAFGNPQFFGGAGGKVVTRASDGLVLGGLGVSGRTNEEDEEIAVVGLAALKAALK